MTTAQVTPLFSHVLKWVHQPDRQSGSWKGTIIAQRQELEGLVSRGVLRKHAEAVLADVYRKAAERAAAETGLPLETYPDACPYALDDLLSADLLAE